MPRQRSPCLPASPTVRWSTPKRESQRQSRCNSPTENNAGLHGALSSGWFRSGLRARPAGSSRFTAVSRRVRIDQDTFRRTMQGVAERAPSCDRQRLGDAFRDRRTTGFPQIRAVRADWRPFWLDCMRVEATGG
jgi:hypothetical protein